MFDLQQLIFSVQRQITKKHIGMIMALIGLFLLTRTINLENFPIFTDEGIYIRWAKVAWQDANWRFISLTDGKQPLHTWGMIPFLKMMPDNALIAGRLFSVLTGFVALCGFFAFCWEFFGKKAAFYGSIIYIFTPYFLFYDRMALIDSGVNAGFIWMLFFSVLLVRKRNLDIALLFGMVAGTTLLAKSSARLFLGLSAFAPVLLLKKPFKKFIRESVNYYVLFAIAAIIAIVMYNIQRLSPFFHYVALKNTTFVLTFAEFIQNPFQLVFTNLRIIPTYVFWELGWVIVVFAALGFYKLYLKDKSLCLYLLIWLLIPYISIAFFAKVIFPRYLIFLGTIITLFAIYYLSHVRSQILQKIFLGILLLSMIFLDFRLIWHAEKASFPPIDRGQYIEGATAVWGAKEFMEFAREKSVEKPVLLLGEGNFGIIGDILETYRRPSDSRLEVKGVWPLGEKEIFEHQKITDKKVYIVFPHREEFPIEWPIQLVKKYSKPGSEKALYVFEYK